MKEDLDNLYLNRPEPQRSALLALRSLILRYDGRISETVKYGMPCFLYGRNILCYLWVDNETGEPYILMADGKHIDNPNLERGNRSRMKILRIDPLGDLPVEIIESVLDQAVGLYEKGIVRLK